MDSVDSTVDLSCTSSSAASTDGGEKIDGEAERTEAQKQQQQQQRRRLIAAAIAAVPSGSGGTHTATSTHTHVTTTSTCSAFQAWTGAAGGQSQTTACSSSSTEICTRREQQQPCDGGQRLICLLSNGVADRAQAHRQLHALNMLRARETPHQVVDGMDPAQRRRRDELFRISGIRGNYPQFFVERQVDNGYGGSKSRLEFWGSYDRMEQLNEVDSLPPDVLLANPQVETWDSVFGNCY